MNRPRRRRTNAELAVIDDIIVDVCEIEHPVTLRGVYYRVVSRGAIEKTENAYNLIGRRLLGLRRTGRVPYRYIADESRNVQQALGWRNLEERLRGIAETYDRDIWDNQDTSIVVLSEKDAIAGVVREVIDRWQVTYGSTRGYASETFAHGLAAAVREHDRKRKRTVIFNLGDHDPSGVDVWRDLTGKIRDFAPHADIHFERLAVTEQQIIDFNLPTRPTKTSDSRSKDFTGGSVEVDAIESRLLRRLLSDAIETYIDHDRLAETKRLEADERQQLRDLIGGAAQ